jgi:hypothetical protein
MSVQNQQTEEQSTERPTVNLDVEVSYTAYDELRRATSDELDESDVIEFLLTEYADRHRLMGATDG